MTRRSWLEVGAVALTGLLHPLFVEVLHLRAIFIAVALTGWLVYVVARVRADRSSLEHWGFSRRNLPASFAATGVVALIAMTVMAIVGAREGRLALDPHMLPLLGLYPIWGLAQQLMVQGIFANSLARKPSPGIRPAFVAVMAAALFAVVHLPDLTLTIATFLMGLCFTPIYLRYRNLWPLGLFHGWLGVFCYFWVLGIDPWRDLLGMQAAGL